MSYFDLPVFFRGKRTYIQGSVILSLAAQTMVSEGFIKDLSNAKLVKVKFNQISDKGVKLLTPGSTPTVNDIVLGEASFKDGGDVLNIHFIEDTPVTPPRENDRPSLMQNFTIAEPLIGGCDYKINATLDDLLAAVVEVVKALHADLSDDVYDIWFTGFSGAAYPLDPKAIATRGTIAVRNIMKKNAPDFIQTLFRITLSDEKSNKPSAFMLTFAYKCPED